VPVTGQDLQFVPQRGPLLSPVGPTHCAYTHTAGWRGWVRLGGWCKFQDDIYQQSRITGLLVEQLRRLTQSQTEAEPVCSGSPCKISKFTKKWLFEPLNSMKCNTHTHTPGIWPSGHIPFTIHCVTPMRMGVARPLRRLSDSSAKQQQKTRQP